MINYTYPAQKPFYKRIRKPMFIGVFAVFTMVTVFSISATFGMI